MFSEIVETRSKRFIKNLSTASTQRRGPEGRILAAIAPARVASTNLPVRVERRCCNHTYFMSLPRKPFGHFPRVFADTDQVRLKGHTVDENSQGELFRRGRRRQFFDKRTLS